MVNKDVQEDILDFANIIIRELDLVLDNEDFDRLLVVLYRTYRYGLRDARGAMTHAVEMMCDKVQESIDIERSGYEK